MQTDSLFSSKMYNFEITKICQIYSSNSLSQFFATVALKILFAYPDRLTL